MLNCRCQRCWCQGWRCWCQCWRRAIQGICINFSELNRSNFREILLNLRLTFLRLPLLLLSATLLLSIALPILLERPILLSKLTTWQLPQANRSSLNSPMKLAALIGLLLNLTEVGFHLKYKTLNEKVHKVEKFEKSFLKAASLFSWANFYCKFSIIF